MMFGPDCAGSFERPAPETMQTVYVDNRNSWNYPSFWAGRCQVCGRLVRLVDDAYKGKVVNYHDANDSDPRKGYARR